MRLLGYLQHWSSLRVAQMLRLCDVTGAQAVLAWDLLIIQIIQASGRRQISRGWCGWCHLVPSSIPSWWCGMAIPVVQLSYVSFELFHFLSCSLRKTALVVLGWMRTVWLAVLEG